MRTISKTLKKRLIAQAEEANFQGFDKIAKKLNSLAENNPTRQDFEEYVYSSKDLKNDIENLFWNAVVRTQDYYGKTADAKEIGDIVEVYAGELISAIRSKIGGDVIGPHEPLTPGEERLIVEIDDV